MTVGTTIYNSCFKKHYYVPWWGIFWWMPKYEKMGTGELFQVLYLVLVAPSMLDSQPGEKPLSPESGSPVWTLQTLSILA